MHELLTRQFHSKKETFFFFYFLKSKLQSIKARPGRRGRGWRQRRIQWRGGGGRSRSQSPSRRWWAAPPSPWARPLWTATPSKKLRNRPSRPLCADRWFRRRRRCRRWSVWLPMCVHGHVHGRNNQSSSTRPVKPYWSLLSSHSSWVASNFNTSQTNSYNII